MSGYKYAFIKDIDQEIATLSSSEIKSLADIWREQRAKIADTESIRLFNEKLCREWAIETGIIENLYTIDRGITVLLIEQGIDASLIPHDATNKDRNLVVNIINDQRNALEGIFTFIKGTRPLSLSYIKELHQAMTIHQETVTAVDQFGHQGEVGFIRGTWKTMPNNPTRPDGKVHEYCPPEYVQDEMDKLLSLHNDHISKRIPPEIEAAWLHHRFTQIHPFQDGNGRIARSLASLVFMKESWFPLVINRDMRGQYITALEEADNGDLKPLVDIFVKQQKSAFIKALSLSEDIIRNRQSVSALIDSAMFRIKKTETTDEKYATLIKLSSELEKMTTERMKDIASKLNEGFRAENQRRFNASVLQSSTDNDHWYKYQITEAAKRLNYFADTRLFRKCIRLKINVENSCDIIFSFHSIGTSFVGLFGVSGFVSFREKIEKTGDFISSTHTICEDVFQFSYNEKNPELIARYEKWLQYAIINGIEEWRRQL